MGDLSNVSAIPFHDRLFHHLDNLAGKNPTERAGYLYLAHNEAVAEMLEEVHTMLRHLTGVADDNEEGG